ncbi:MAG: biotin/lipoate A/B protein ligase family protein [Candidatus Riflebacteria bacterium]|nr:biotin/lipoate A/B protein ligase family protein [Candidatus Riflebacteria bacterium]
MTITSTSNPDNNLTLRFINSGAQPPEYNMALDEALAISLAQKRNFCYLRFYRWYPASLSFGYNQRIERLIDFEEAARHKLGIVRRMSGGKMVFHADEHTFSLGMTAEFIKAATGSNATFLDMFKFAIEPLVEALLEQGVPARFAAAREMESGRRNHLHCYAAAAGHSIFAGQHKLIGAAGVFRGDCLIIHGSIPISVVAPPTKVFLPDHTGSVNIEMAALSDFLPPGDIASIPDYAAKVYSRHCKCLLINDLPDENELSLATKLAREKYSQPDWPQKSAITGASG